MASRVKKDAANALDELTVYLSRDSRAMQLLGNVERYLSALRRERSEANDKCNAACREHAELRRSAIAATTDADKLGTQLRQLTAENQQLLREIQAANKRYLKSCADADAQNEDLNLDISAPENYKALMRVAKQLRRRLKKPPAMNQGKNGLTIIPLSSIVRDFAGHEFATLGMFCTVVSLLGFPVGISAQRITRPDGGDDALAPMVRWMLPWIGWSEESWKAQMAIQHTENPRLIQGGSRIKII